MRLVLITMKVCAVKDRANNGLTLVSRFAPHQVVSVPGISHGTSEVTPDVPSPRSYWRLSDDFLLEEKGYSADLFHTYCKVGEKVWATMIDHDSLINAVRVDMVDKLHLSMTPHPRPYSLRRCYDKLAIMHQTIVLFSIGKFSCEVLCDIIPVPMDSCHMLLGEPWYRKNNAAYDYLANTYTVEWDRKYVLMAMENKLFRTWRKERLQKMKEKQEPKTVRTVTEFSSVHIQPAEKVVAEETDLKPRTVSLEGREDDTASPSSDLVDVAVARGFKGMQVGSATTTYHMLNMDQGAHAYASTCTDNAKALAGSALNTSRSDLVRSYDKIRDTIDLFELPRPPEVSPDSVWTSIDDFMWDSNWRDRGTTRGFKRKSADKILLYISAMQREVRPSII
ncbi:hypothetical protein VPH35_007759 [Triticum aestivum]